jgi:hypothetical protein
MDPGCIKPVRTKPFWTCFRIINDKEDVEVLDLGWGETAFPWWKE